MAPDPSPFNVSMPVLPKSFIFSFAVNIGSITGSPASLYIAFDIVPCSPGPSLPSISFIILENSIFCLSDSVMTAGPPVL